MKWSISTIDCIYKDLYLGNCMTNWSFEKYTNLQVEVDMLEPEV